MSAQCRPLAAPGLDDQEKRSAGRQSEASEFGHSKLGITSVYLEGIDNAEMIETVHACRAPIIPVSTTLSPATSGRKSSSR